MSIPKRARRRRHGETVRIALFLAGCLLILVAPVAGLLPGPVGILVAAAGLSLVLKTSGWARRRYVRFKRRWPRSGDLLDRGMRRASQRRRRALLKAAAN